MQKTFPRGGNKRLPDHKEATAGKPILTLPAPPIAVIPMGQHIGAPCEPLVNVGDKVKVGSPWKNRGLCISQYTPVFPEK